MKLSKTEAKLLQAVSVTIRDEDGQLKHIKVRGNRILAFQFDKFYEPAVKRFLTKLTSWEGWREKRLELNVKVWYRQRSLEQNNLMWALLSILSLEVYGQQGHEQELYQDILDMYAPVEVSLLTGKRRVKSSSNCNTIEMANIINGVFIQLAEHGIEVTDPAQIANYWKQWYVWRGEQQFDPISIKNKQDYKEKVPFCEACMDYLGNGDGQIAHIVSKGSSGPDEPWNFMHLCTKHHIGGEGEGQHEKGWGRLLELFPHLRWRIEEARERGGKLPLREGDKPHETVSQDSLY